MRILRSIHSLNPAIGGPMEVVRQTSAALSARGHNVEVATFDSPGDPWLADFPVAVQAFGPAPRSYGYVSRYARWLEACQSQYDAVLVHGLWQYNSFGTWRALHGSSTPYFVFPHGMLDPWFNRTYPLKHLKKLLYWPWAEYRVLRDARAVLFTSEQERLLARKSFAPYRANEIVVNYGTAAPSYDLTVAREEFFRAFPHLIDRQFLLFLGRLTEKKGCDILIEAFAAFQASSLGDDALHLVMAGPSSSEPYLASLKKLAASTHDLPVTFAGMLSGNLKWGALSAANAFILSSHQENFGIAVVEALACGTPVLISNQVNIWREIVEDGAGFAASDDRDGTLALMQRWAAMPSSEQDSMRAAARACFDRRFEINRAVDSLLAAISD